MKEIAEGILRKMKSRLEQPVSYKIPLGDNEVPLNPLIAKKIKLEYSGNIFCVNCGRKSNKSFNQGYCYPCFTSLAQCDICIVRPEQCHYDQGTCREPEWGLKHCMHDHIVYLANSSGVKVGITRRSQVPTRWIDQGAIQALAVFRVNTRLQAGLVEVIFKSQVSDRTSWQKMLKGNNPEIDLLAVRDEIFEQCNDSIGEVKKRFGDESVEMLNDSESINIDYPVVEYPTKVKSFNFDKTANVSGKLMGIKGQYLIFDSGVLNIRKFAGYDVKIDKLAS